MYIDGRICGALGSLNQGFSGGPDMAWTCVTQEILVKGWWGEGEKQGK